jgi:GR25 family glycosyltransferase involved in LPS biosynthesis
MLKKWHMPHCYQCNNDDLLVTTSNLKRSDFNIPDDAFAFCHFNHEYKLDRKTWFVWMSILKRVPNSVLVFTTFCPTFVKVLFHDANINGISKERLIYLNYETDREKHFNRINLCNLGLDCYKLNGHTSSSDLIASGIPLITYTSETYHNRVAKSILKAVDLEELVCYSFEEYTDLAVRLATNKTYYNSIVKKVIKNRTKYLFNTKLYVENFVNMLHTIWDNEKTKDKIEETQKEEKEEKEEEIINKDYNLPVFNIVFNDFDNATFMFKVKKLLNYICNQNYLNIQLIIIINNEINTQNLAVLNEVIYFNNVYYYNDIPDDLINIITVDSNNFETITDDLFFVSNYYKNNKETVNSDITNIISHKSIDLSKLYNDKMEKLKKLTINSENFENLPHIYWINLERSHERREKTIELLDQYKLKHTRIDACDYLSFDDFSANNVDEFYNYKIEETKRSQIKALDEIKENNNNHKKRELSCLSSHLKAIEIFLKTNDEYCIIAEDDISVEYTKYWNNTFWEWFEGLPDDWECVQLTQILTVQSIHNCNYLLDRINVMPYKSNFSWSTTAYMLNRKGAQKLLDTVKIFDNKYYFKNLNESIADVFIYKYLNTFTIPLFTYMMNYDSTINNNNKHLEISKKCIDKIWINYYESKTNSF